MSHPEVEALLTARMVRFENPEKVRATASQIIRLCHLLGFQPSFILAVIEHESSFKSHIVSPAGAIGLMQLLPATARIVGSQIGIDVPHGGPNLKDPVVNVTLGMHYLAQLQDDFKTPASTLAAYNLGPQRWVQYLEKPARDRPRSVAKYVSLIERTSKEMQQAGKLAYRKAMP
jgi:soluble lytic murein transglycosylase-like protein